MPRSGRAWYHQIWSTYASWLPGDPRGFRNRGHRLHSSGDYKNPPPPGEHARLHAQNRQRHPKAIEVEHDLRQSLAASLIELTRLLDARLNVVSVADKHAHLLIELEEDWDAMMTTCGLLRTYGSRAMRHTLPGRLWSGGHSPKRIKDVTHQRNTFRYIAERQEEGVFVWAYTDPLPPLPVPLDDLLPRKRWRIDAEDEA